MDTITTTRGALSARELDDARVIALAAASCAGRNLMEGGGCNEGIRDAVDQALGASMVLAGLGGYPEDHPAADWSRSAPDFDAADLRSIATAHRERYASWDATEPHLAEVARAERVLAALDAR